MIWIHGGGYTTGAKNIYFGAPLAVTGGLLGFLSNGTGEKVSII